MKYLCEKRKLNNNLWGAIFPPFLKNFFEENYKSFKIDIVFLYGFYAFKKQKESSDVDIAILFLDGLKEEEKFNLVVEISYILEKKIKKEVNIISLSKDFPDPCFYYDVIVLGKVLFYRKFDDYVKFKLEALYQFEDFQIFGIEWKKELARKRLKEFGYDWI